VHLPWKGHEFKKIIHGESFLLCIESIILLSQRRSKFHSNTLNILKVLVQLTIPSGIQADVRLEIESIEFMSAEAVAVWYGIIDTTHELNSTGNLITQTQHNGISYWHSNTTKKPPWNAWRCSLLPDSGLREWFIGRDAKRRTSRFRFRRDAKRRTAGGAWSDYQSGGGGWHFRDRNRLRSSKGFGSLKPYLSCEWHTVLVTPSLGLGSPQNMHGPKFEKITFFLHPHNFYIYASPLFFGLSNHLFRKSSETNILDFLEYIFKAETL